MAPVNNPDIRIKVAALGGLDESGKNLLTIEVDGDIFIVEAGLKYPDKFTPGVDFLIPSFEYLRENSRRVKGIIITHGHDDIYGALPYLLSAVRAPVYLTNTTMSMIRADYGRKINLTHHTFVIIEPSSEIDIAGHRFSFFSTCHSISESCGFVLRTDLGNIVYTGDYISDYNGLKHFTFDFAKVASIANEHNTLLLFTESSGADKPGIASPNHRLTPHIKSAIEEQDSRLFIALYTQNFYNIQEIIDLAQINNKKIVVLNKRLVDALPEINARGNLIIPKNNRIESDEMIRYSTKDIIVLVTGSGEELFEIVTAIANGDYPDKHLCLNDTDHLIMACPSVPGTETIATEALDAVYRSGAEVKSLSRRELASMHAQQEDLKMMLSLFRPRYYMPIKGEYRQLMANAKIALSTGLGYNHMNTIIYDNGMMLGIDKAGKLVQLPRIKEGDQMVSGNIVGDMKESVLTERQKLADDGIVVLSAAVSARQQKIVSNPDVQMRGFIYLKDQQNILNEINSAFNETLKELMNKRMMSTGEAERKLTDRLSKYFKKETGKNPLILTQIIDIDAVNK